MKKKMKTFQASLEYIADLSSYVAGNLCSHITESGGAEGTGPLGCLHLSRGDSSGSIWSSCGPVSSKAVRKLSSSFLFTRCLFLQFYELIQNILQKGLQGAIHMEIVLVRLC